MLTLATVVAELGFVLAIDHCARGCGHCPAFGDRSPVQRASHLQLRQRVEAVAAARNRLGLPAPQRVMHSWRISDPLDYLSRLPDGRVATCVDVAELWRTHLGQGLYVVTNGSEGRPLARRALEGLAADPTLASQVKLTITHADRVYGSARYVTDLARDVAALAPLWQLPSSRVEDSTGLRFRINAKATPDRMAELRACVLEVLTEAGMPPEEAHACCHDPRRVGFKPIYDLGNATGMPSPVVGALDVHNIDGRRYKPTSGTRAQLQYGIRPDGRLFVVDMFAFAEHDLTGSDGPLWWPENLADTDLNAPLDRFAHV